MTPADFTNDLLIGWGGALVFNQALAIAKKGQVVRAEWDDVEHVVSGAIDRGGWNMNVSFEVLDDGTVRSHCPCEMNVRQGLVCPHVVALGIYVMVTYAPDDAPEEDDAPPEDAPGRAGGHDEYADCRFEPGTPGFFMKLSGSRASLGADVLVRYGTTELVCGGAYDPDAVRLRDSADPYLVHTRNPVAEADAEALLHHWKFERGERLRSRFFIYEPRDVLNFLGSGLPYLRNHGWRVELSDNLVALTDEMPSVMPIVKVLDAPRGAFDVGYSFVVPGRSGEISPALVQGAINRGDSYVMTGAQTVLLDLEAISAMRGVFADCACQAGAAAGFFRVGAVYAPYVKAAVESVGVEFDDDDAPSWRETVAARNRDEGARCEPVPLGPLEGVLRPYQKEGVYWLRFLEKSGLSGLLADEMGLGKTLQTLTWLSLARCDPAARGKPALVVCPTSLVANWEAEAAKFTPQLGRLVVSGPDRAKRFASIPRADLVITSYALLQRDFDEAYAGVDFAVVVLDEAQHIKNRRTRNAQTAKRLSSVQKLVLTGTPVENSVSDVWSIFDFLLPGYLADYENFKESTELPIASGGKVGAAAQEKLRHKLHPFILRRLKKTVAKDLPDKIERVHFCSLSEDQQRIYNAALAEARGRLSGLAAGGAAAFRRGRFEMLACLMRLRQIACHVGLLKEFKEGAKNLPAEPSDKLDAFLELLDEAIDGGHRVLVFSQFVSMLAILRRTLEARGVKYCYLDGATKDRLGECRRFNENAAIPVFLVSLHAGGTGLNLTGADVVLHFDPWWNPAVEAQATDRAHRIGQKRQVYVVKMIAQGTIEERVLDLQRRKQAVIDATVDVSDAAVVNSLTFDDVRALLA